MNLGSAATSLRSFEPPETNARPKSCEAGKTTKEIVLAISSVCSLFSHNLYVFNLDLFILFLRFHNITQTSAQHYSAVARTHPSPLWMATQKEAQKFDIYCREYAWCSMSGQRLFSSCSFWYLLQDMSSR